MALFISLPGETLQVARQGEQLNRFFWQPLGPPLSWHDTSGFRPNALVALEQTRWGSWWHKGENLDRSKGKSGCDAGRGGR